MAWIESHQGLERHPKTFDLMARMEWDIDTAIGKLHRFWWWCVDYAPDGDLRKHTDVRIGQALGMTPAASRIFVRAMISSCWIDRDPYFRVHDWWDYFGTFLQVKYKHKPEQWKAVRALYKPEIQNGSYNGSYNGTPNQPNQPPPKPPAGRGVAREGATSELGEAPRLNRKPTRAERKENERNAGIMEAINARK